MTTVDTDIACRAVPAVNGCTLLVVLYYVVCENDRSIFFADLRIRQRPLRGRGSLVCVWGSV